MRHHYCTLFDSAYLSRGLTMYESIVRTAGDFHLYIFPFDEEANRILRSLQLPGVTIVSLDKLESDELRAIRLTRNKKEYCWTCTPFVIQYCLTQFSLTSCTYVDADLYFYANPAVLCEEMGNDSILITDHHYSRRYDQSTTSGKYCVQFISFRNDEKGWLALRWWRDRCMEWCFDRMEEGKFGDQKYLDDWTTRFEGVHVLAHLGGGLAPWNVQRFRISSDSGQFFVLDEVDEKPVPLVFYHFHGMRFPGDGKVDLGAYDLKFQNIFELYQRYLHHLAQVEKSLRDVFDWPLVIQTPTGIAIFRWFRKGIRKLLGVYNVFPWNGAMGPVIKSVRYD